MMVRLPRSTARSPACVRRFLRQPLPPAAEGTRDRTTCGPRTRSRGHLHTNRSVCLIPARLRSTPPLSMWQRPQRRPQPLPRARNASLSIPQLIQPRARRQRRLPSRNPPFHPPFKLSQLRHRCLRARLPPQRVPRRRHPQPCPCTNRRFCTSMRGQPQAKPRLRLRLPRRRRPSLRQI